MKFEYDDDFDFTDSPDEGSDCEEKMKIIKQIENYQTNFPELINKKSIDKSKKSDIKKYDIDTPITVLQDDLENIQNKINNTGIIKDLSGLCMVAANLIQKISTRTPLKLDGPKCDLVSVVQQNKESFSQVCKELMCKYDMCGISKPEIRLAMLGIQSVLLVHSTNTQEEKEENIVKEKSNETV